MKLNDNKTWLINGRDLVPAKGAGSDKLPENIDENAGRKATMAYKILTDHNTSGNDSDLRIRFDKLTSHDITYVGIIQTARASGLEKFPMPYVLTNCHNSLCAVGGTINEDDHMFGLSAAKKYGGVYVPPMQAVIHQYAREMLAFSGGMILGSDSHTRYGALGTMAMGEGGPELVKQLLGRTYDISMPQVVAIYLTGSPRPGVGPQDVALAIIGETFKNGFVKNKVMEFVGPGIANLSMDFRIGVDVMTTETTCLSSIWITDEKTREYYGIHGRENDYREIKPGAAALYDAVVEIDLDKIVPMIAMPYHPSMAYPIADVCASPYDYLREAEKRAQTAFGDKVSVDLTSKVIDGKIMVDQGLIAGCAGGGFENICAAADILKGKDTGMDKFTLSVYPASTPIYMELIKNGAAADLIAAGAIVKTAFCGPCFGAGDTPANNAFSIRHSTRNFPNREGSKVQNGQISSVALMDARSIAATAANRGILTPATDFEGTYSNPTYFFDGTIYAKRVFDSKGAADPSVELQFGPNIKDWPEMPALTENLLLKVVSEIHDPVTTTDELIPSGETSSLRSNPQALSEYALSRKDPEYVGRAKAVRRAEIAREMVLASKEHVPGHPVREALPELQPVMEKIAGQFKNMSHKNTGIGSTIFAVKPGDGSAREQAASCQKVLGGWANIANEYATKRYRSNLINWGMVPFIIEDKELPFTNGDYIFIPGIKDAIRDGKKEISAFTVKEEGLKEFKLSVGELTDDERQIIMDGCLINYYRG
ncbi:MAG: hydratase [Lachnospiraceae bacterium]